MEMAPRTGNSTHLLGTVPPHIADLRDARN